MKRSFKLLSLITLSLIVVAKSANATNTEDDLRSWAQNATAEVMTFDFVNFEKKKEDNKSFFTPDGFKKFYAALDRSKIPEIVMKNKYMVETKALCYPEITESPSGKNGFYILEFPSSTTWIQAQKAKRDYMRIKMKVFRAADGNGFGIEQWLATMIDEQEASACSNDDFKRIQIETLKQEIKKREEKIKDLESELN